MNMVKKYLQFLYSNRLIIGSYIILLPSFCFAQGTTHSVHSIDWDNIIYLFVGSLLTFLGGIFSELIREWLYRSQVKIEFDPNGNYAKDFFSETFATTSDGRTNIPTMYIRGKAKNINKYEAKDCRVYLVKIEKKDNKGRFQPTHYCDIIQLAWSCRNESDRFEPVNIKQETPQFFDILAIINGHSDVFLPQIYTKPNRYYDLWEDKGIFRFTIMLSIKNGKPAYLTFVFTWNGFNDFKVYREGTKEPLQKFVWSETYNGIPYKQ